MSHETTPAADEASRNTTDPHPTNDSQDDQPEHDTDAAPSPRSFDDMDLEPDVRRALDEMGYQEPMEVQSAVYEPVVHGRDVMVQSRTGSGKTAAFGIPLSQKIDPESSGAQVLCLAPTRELALQVARELEALGKHKGLHVVPVYGGAPMKPQIDALRGGAQVVAGTPGRVLDHIRRGTFRTDQIRYLVLDECDEMLSMGFQEEIENILERLPPAEERQSLLFSATIPDGIQRIARRYMREPIEISLSEGNISVDEIDHHYYVVSGMARTRDLLKVLKAERPDSALIFCNTREDTNTVAKFLVRHGYDAEAISSDLTQRDRERVMKRMRDGNLHFLVATDVAARGIDISHLSHVINYTFPESPEVYVHRTGRTGRAGRSGVAISLVGPREIGAFYYLKLIYKIRPEERDLPSTDELEALRQGEQYQQVVDRVPDEPGEQYRALARRLWQSSEGERVVGALLQQVLEGPRPAARKSKRDDGRANRDDGKSTKTRRDDGKSKAKRDDDGKRKRRAKDEGDRPRTSSKKSDDGPATRGDDERPRRRRRRRRRDDDGAGAEAARKPRARTKDDGPAKADGAGEDEPAKKARSRDEDDGGKKRSRRKKNDSGEPKEFWETWAEEKSSRDDDGDDADGGDDDQVRDKKRTTRLYVNLGKREDITADQLRALLREDLAADEAEQIGAVALRNTHCYVRVPEELVDKVIESSTGKTFEEREVVVERAKK